MDYDFDADFTRRMNGKKDWIEGAYSLKGKGGSMCEAEACEKPNCCGYAWSKESGTKKRMCADPAKDKFTKELRDGTTAEWNFECPSKEAEVIAESAKTLTGAAIALVSTYLMMQ